MVKNSKNYKNYEIDWNNVRPLPGSWVDEQQKKWIEEGKAEGEFTTKLLFISQLSKKMPKEQIASMLEMSLEEIDQLLKHQK